MTGSASQLTILYVIIGAGRGCGIQVDRYSVVGDLGVILDNYSPGMATNLIDELLHDVKHILPCVISAGMEECKREDGYLDAQSADDVNSLAAPPPDRCKLVGNLSAH